MFSGSFHVASTTSEVKPFLFWGNIVGAFWVHMEKEYMRKFPECLETYF